MMTINDEPMRTAANMVLRGFYILKNEFFEIMDDPYLKNNKDGSLGIYG